MWQMCLLILSIWTGRLRASEPDVLSWLWLGVMTAILLILVSVLVRMWTLGVLMLLLPEMSMWRGSTKFRSAVGCDGFLLNVDCLFSGSVRVCARFDDWITLKLCLILTSFED